MVEILFYKILKLYKINMFLKFLINFLSFTFQEIEFENVFGFYRWMLKYGVIFMRNKIFLMRQKWWGLGVKGVKIKKDWGDDIVLNQ